MSRSISRTLAVGMLVVLGGSPAVADDFSSDGVVLGDEDDTQDVSAIARDAGALYLAGTGVAPGNGEWRIEKRTLDGVLVAAFGTDGVVRSNPSVNWDVPRGIWVNGDDVYVVGQDGLAGSGASRWRIEKRSATTGALVPAFGSAGIVTVGPDAAASAVVSDGASLFIVGGSGSQWRLEKRSAGTGALDMAFANRTTPGANGAAYAATLSGGSLFVGGSEGFSSWRIERRNPADGSLVYAVTETFPDVGCGPQGVFAIAADATGLYLAGEASGAWRVERRDLATGSISWFTSLQGSGSCDSPAAIVLDGPAMVIAGRHGYGWRIEKRLLSGGSFVLSFGSGGVAASPVLYCEPYAMVTDATDLYIGGCDPVAGAVHQARVERRRLSDGAFDGGSSVPTTVPSTTTTSSTLPGACEPIALDGCAVQVRFSAGPVSDRFKIRCETSLGGQSDGIDPVREGLRITLTDADSPACDDPCFAETIVPQRAGRCWRYRAPRGATTALRALKLCDVDPARGRYRLVARAIRTNLQCLNTPAPYQVGLAIGDDCTHDCGSSSSTTTTLASTTTSTTRPPGPCTARTVSSSPTLVVNAPGSRAWENPGAATVEDGQRATVTNLAPGELSDHLVVDQLGFALPFYARIRGIQVDVKRSSANGTGIQDADVQLLREGYPRAERTISGLWSATEGWVSYGGPDDTWGATWTADDVDAADFAVGVAVRNASTSAVDSARIDHIRVTVYYVDATSVVGPRSPTAAVDDAAIGTRAWSSPSSALVADGNSAVVSAMIYPEVSHYLRATGFGFNPSQAPTGILLEVKHATDLFGTYIADNAVRLTLGGSTLSADRSGGSWSPGNGYQRYGGPDDRWGTTWNTSAFGTSSFGAVISARYPMVSGNDYAMIDHLRITLLFGAFNSQVTRAPAAATSVLNSYDWYAPGEALVEDGRTSDVRLTFDHPSSFLVASGFGFALPDTARIDGVTLTVVRAARDPDTIVDHAVRLLENGIFLPADRARPDGWTPAYTTVDYGGPTDTWGTTWTAADLNAGALGAGIQTAYTFFAGNNDAAVDAIRVTVHYCD